jgi:hypothetical protein
MDQFAAAHGMLLRLIIASLICATQLAAVSVFFLMDALDRKRATGVPLMDLAHRNPLRQFVLLISFPLWIVLPFISGILVGARECGRCVRTGFLTWLDAFRGA